MTPPRQGLLATIVRGATTAVAAIIVVAALVLVPAVPSAGQDGQVRAGRVQVRLVSQTTWVDPDGEIVVRVAVENAPDDATVEVTLHERVRSRADFLETTQRQRLRGRLTDPAIDLGPLHQLDATPTVRIPIRSGPQDPEAPPRLGIADPGVHPIDIAVYSADREYLGGLVTHVVRLPPPGEDLPLSLVLVQPLDAGLSHRPDGSVVIDHSTRAAWTVTVDALLDKPQLSVLLAVRPETVSALAASTSELDRLLLANLARLADGATVGAATFVNVDVDALLRADLADEIAAQVVLGADELESHLGTGPDSTWMARTSLSEDALDALVAVGVERLVVARDMIRPAPAARSESTPSQQGGADDEPDGDQDAGDEDPIDPDEPLLQAVEIVTAAGAEVNVVATDPYLQQHQGRSGDPRLDAQHLLADLAVLWFADPTSPRMTALDLGATTEPAFIATLLSGLEASPLLETEAVGSLAASGTDAETAPLRYRLVEPAASVDLSGLRRDLDLARLTITSYRGVFAPASPSDLAEGEPGGPPGSDLDFDRLLSVVPAAELSSQERSAYFTTIAESIDQALSGIDIQARAITLPARDGTVPVILHNDSGRPAVVTLKFESDRLDFPAGDHVEVPLPPGATTVEVTVRARASGAFPLDIEVESPDGRLALATSRYTVRSTAVSGVGVAISVAAIAVLAVWWIKTARRARAARGGTPETKVSAQTQATASDHAG